MSDIKTSFQDKFPSILLNEDLNKHCTFRIGGPADFFFKAKNEAELPEIIKFANKNKIPYFIIGGGSNVLFDDKGFRGLIIKIELNNILKNEGTVTADSGVFCSKLVSISGLEKWTGLPGTVGGAVRGNAGCNGLETKDILIKAKLLDPQTGEIKEVDNEYFNFGYRYSKLKDSNEIVINATFKLEKSINSTENSQKLTEEISKNRLGKQPIGLSAGSFFKNPSLDNPAGLLIEKSGLKGKTIGKAQISEKHANFIINLGGASSTDVKELAKLIKCEVKAKFGIDLKEEVQILSETGKIPL